MIEGREEAAPASRRRNFVPRRRRFTVATLLAAGSIVAAACVPPPPPPPPSQGKLIGAVTNKGTPVPGAVVGFETPDGFPLPISATANSAGQYTIDLNPAQYRVFLSIPGVPECGEWFNNKPDRNTADLVTISAGQSTTADADLNCPIIAGHVTDTAGNPRPGVDVTVAPANLPFGPITATTDADGDYRVFFAPGSYKVRFIIDACEEWFNEKPGSASADVVTLSPGDEFVANSQLDCGIIAGTVTDGASPLAGVDVLAGAGLINASEPTDATGFYSFHVPAGDYVVRFTRPDGCPTEWFDDKPTQLAADVVSVAAGATSTASAAMPCGTLAGTVTDESGNPPPRSVRVDVTDVAGNVVQQKVAASDGTYTFRLVPGSYKVFFTDVNGLFDQTWFNQKPDLVSADVVTVSNGATATANATLDIPPP